MHSILKLICLVSLFSFLVSCSQTPTPQVSNDISHVASIDIDVSANQAEIEAQYGAKALIFRPEDGFALLGFTAEQNQLSTLNTSENEALSVPSMEASGWNAWSGGWNAWSGGWNAWSGGWNAWSGGVGSVPTAPSENNAVWNKLKLQEAHAMSTNFGQGQIIAVLDTGIDPGHPMFQGRLVSNYKRKDFIDGDNIPREVPGTYFGHGTAVAGIIAQIAPQARILPIRVLDGDGKGDISTIAQGVDWAISQGARVINLSLGSRSNIEALRDIISYASYKNVYVVMSAGNEGNTNLLYPARYASSIVKAFSVGSIDNNGCRSGFSNQGSFLNTAAVGENVYSAYPGNRVAKFTGTSFAAPVVSGALALARGEADTGTKKNKLANYLLDSAALQPDSCSGSVYGPTNLEAMLERMATVDY